MSKILVIVSSGYRNIIKAHEKYHNYEADKRIIFTSIKNKENLLSIERLKGNFKCISKFKTLYKLFKLNKLTIIFCDGSFSTISIRLIKLIHTRNINAKIIRLQYLPLPEIKSNWFNYIFNKVGAKKNSIIIPISNLFKLLLFSLLRYPYNLVKNSTSKVTFLVPNYSLLEDISYERSKCYISNRPLKNFNLDLVYLDSIEDPTNYALLEIVNYLKIIADKLNNKNIYIKFHPSSTKKQNQDFLSKINSLGIKDIQFLKYDSSKKENKIFIGYSTSGLFTLKSKLSISLVNLIEQENFKWFSKFIGVDQKEYINNLYTFFKKPANFLMPYSKENLKEEFSNRLM